VHPRGADIQLRRKHNSPTKDAVILALMRTDLGVTGTIARPDHDNGAPFPIPAEDIPKIEKLWQNVEQQARAALPKRNSIHSVRLDGQDVYVQDLAPKLFDRLIERYSPFVHEIARRSPSAHELSLKLERDDGRREELFVRKSELLEELTALEPRMRSRFASLGFVPAAQ
jgi:hypothetical protein